MQKRDEQHLLYFTRKEKNGIVGILFLVLLLVFLPRLYVRFFPEKIPPSADLQQAVALLRRQQADSNRKDIRYHEGKPYDAYRPVAYPKDGVDYSKTLPLFQFDPNSLSAEGWKKLGVKEKTAGSIQKYIAKGGRFRRPEDIRKIWGLPEKLADRLLPYVTITEKKPVYSNGPIPASTEKKRPEHPVININDADSALLEQLPGIGARLSQRIIAYREKLGGFYAVEQLAEIFGLHDSTYQKIAKRVITGNAAPRKVNINKATLDEMKQHPYIRYKIANAIVQFRDQHGPFAATGDIRKIMLIDEQLFTKLAPYITVN